MLSRRDLLKRSALLTALMSQGLLTDVFGDAPKKKLHIGACDWSIGKSSDIGAFEVAKQIGLEGVQVNLGSDENALHLRQKSRQQAYLAESKRTGVKIAGLAISELNRVPYKSEPRTEEWVWDAVDVAKNLGVKVILLAFFSKNDLRDDEPGKKEVIKRLRIVAPKAEKMGITLGIESYLSAQEHLDIMERVGSKSVKVYVDFRNSADAGYDVINEIKLLGKDAICELHMKENGFLLGQGTLNWKKIAQTLNEMDYVGGGWMQIEGARPEGTNIVDAYKHNREYLRSLFKI
jgi:sugar phosphate isomerase/epimerase